MSSITDIPRSPLDELSDEVRREYIAMKVLPDGRICGVHRLMFHWTLHVDIDYCGYADKYCYQHVEIALAAMEVWNGEGDPFGWHRHLNSGRRRDIATGEEWIQW